MTDLKTPRAAAAKAMIVGSAGGPHRRRPVLQAGALTLGVITGAGNLAGPPGAPGAPADVVQRDDIMLTGTGEDIGAAAAASPFDQSLKYLLDTILGAGTKTLPQLITAGDSTLTIGQLLGHSDNGSVTVNTELHLDSLLDLLGLNKADSAPGTYDGETVGALMTALNLSPNKTVDAILQQMQLANVTLDQLLTPLGIPSTQTLYGLFDRLSLLNQTLTQGIQKFGPIGDPDTQKVSDALDSIGLGGFYSGWFTGSSLTDPGLGYLCTGVKGTVEDALECVQTHYKNADTQHPNFTLKSNETIGYLLTHIYQISGTYPGNSQTTANFNEPIGAYTIGQALGFDNTTTVQQFVDKLMVNMNVTAGQTDANGNPIVTTVSPNSSSTEFSGNPGTVSVAPSDDPAQSPYPGVSLGSQTFGSVLNWFNLNPDETLAQVIDNLTVGGNKMGTLTVGQALEGLVVDPAAIGSAPVDDNTPVDNYLTAIGFNDWTLDQLIGLDPPPAG